MRETNKQTERQQDRRGRGIPRLWYDIPSKTTLRLTTARC